MLKTKKMYNMLVPNDHFKNGIFNLDFLKDTEFTADSISKALDSYKKQVLSMYIKNVEQFHNDKIKNTTTHVLVPENAVDENSFPTILFFSILKNQDISKEEKNERIINLSNIIIRGTFQVGVSNLDDVLHSKLFQEIYIDIANPIPEIKHLNH